MVKIVTNKKNDKILELYKVLTQAYQNKENISLEQIERCTGWRKKTFPTYYNKKLKDRILQKDGKDSYKIINVDNYDEESFLRLMSQIQEKSESPFKKELPVPVNELVKKAKQSAMLAVDIYNRPQTEFRTEGFIVMMNIAWTSLIHSIFELNNVDYYSKNKEGKVVIIEGDKKTLELSECLKIADFINVNIISNLDFLIKLRNKIEHRFIPELDLNVCGECQSSLLNFENLLYSKYGYSISTNLAIPLQLTNFEEQKLIDAKKKLQANNLDSIQQFIFDYRKNLADDVYNSLEYSFKCFLVPKTANNINRSDVSMEFINVSELNENDRDTLSKTMTIVKEKNVQVANHGKYKPKTICDIVSKEINKKFSVNSHTNAWKFYEVRKSGYTASECNVKYCQYDEVHNDYIYTKEWVDFLIEKLKIDDEYNKIINFKNKS